MINFDNSKPVALLLGNGLNNYADSKKEHKNYMSWNDLLAKLSKHIGIKEYTSTESIRRLLKDGGISHPEIYSALEFLYQENQDAYNELSIKFDLRNSKNRPDEGIEPDRLFRDIIVSEMSKWRFASGVHDKFVQFAYSHNCPILTTNFDFLLEKSFGGFAKDDDIYTQSHRLAKSKRRSSRYPFDEYFSTKELSEKSFLQEFAIWHIHGHIKRPASLNLSSKNYLYFHKKLQEYWNEADSATSWQKIFFDNDLVIVGLGLSASEYPLRALLLQRMNQIKRTKKKRRTIYLDIQKEIERNEGKVFFLQAIGIDVIEAENYSKLYSRFGIAE